MHYIGVDLAWGEVKPTGLAVLDGAGRLLHVSAATDDDSILDALAPYVGGDCLVAIDAPLIVVNATGNRPAEAALNRDFARFQAGAHPSNTGKPEFADQPRGARLASRLKLDMDPRSGRARRAIEVYPHPATIALFGLGQTLKYKNKPGRDLDRLRSELLVLIGLLEGLADADPPMSLDSEAWRELRTGVENAARKSDLRVVEDQVDAVVCAYVALFAHRKPTRTTTYGDFATGYIVTPSLATDPVGAAVGDYAALQPTLEPTTTAFVDLVTSTLDEAGINYLSVTGRTKAVASYAAKAARVADPDTDITDQIGVRVITYVQSDVQAVVDLLEDQVVVHDDRDMGQEAADQGRFGYASRHLLISLDTERADLPRHSAMRGHRASVQIRTVLQHAWAEFEHEVRYKGTIPEEHVSDFDRRFTLAAGLLELADREFSTIRDRLAATAGSGPEPADDDPRISPRELAAFLAGQYADAGWSRTDHYAWMSGLLLELGITSLAELGDAIRPVEAEQLSDRMGYRYPPGAVRRLDDALLWVYGEDYVNLRGNADRVDALQARQATLRNSSGPRSVRP
jgi:predicted RNase H-like nuclease/ppGpp synthetase/RelA/SpoT-type nucleotidyltranferase